MSGSVGYNTPVADRNIDLNVYTFKTDGSTEVETIGMPQTFAFGYSAGESVKINDYGHQVVAYDGGAYVLSELSTQSVWDGSEYSQHSANQWVVFNVEQGVDGHWSINNDKSFVFDENGYNVNGNNFPELSNIHVSERYNTNIVGADATGLYVRGADDSDLYYLDAVLANSFETGALTKVVDQPQTGWSGAQYGVEITDDPSVVQIFIREFDQDNQTWGGEHTFSSVDFTKGSETIVLESGSASEAYGFQGDNEVQPNYEVETSDINLIPLGTADGTSLNFYPWSQVADMSQEVLIVGPTYYNDSYPQHEYAYILVRDEVDGSYTQYSIDYSVFGHPSGSTDKLQATNDGVSFRY